VGSRRSRARCSSSLANATYVYLMATLDPMHATAASSENEYGLGAGDNTRVVGYAKQ
jgi:hypothetical protein